MTRANYNLLEQPKAVRENYSARHTINSPKLIELIEFANNGKIP